MTKWKPHPYQLEAIRMMITRGAAGLFLDPGLGKTSISLMASKILLEKKLVKGVLVIAPLRPARVTWPEEVRKWVDFNNLSLVVLHGKDKDKLLEEKHDIYVINPEGLLWLIQPKIIKSAVSLSVRRMDYLMERFNMLIVDESTKFKSSSSQRFKVLKATLNYWRRRYILTGTPAPNGLQDIWAQIFLLDGGSSLSPYITHFRNEYYYLAPNSHQYDYRLFPNAADKIATKIDHLVLRLRAEDYLQLPQLSIVKVEVDLEPKTREHYKTLEKEFALLLKEGTVTVANSAVLSNKLRQVVSGAVYLDGKVVDINTTKVDALAELVEELSGQPLLVGYDFVFEKELIKKAIPHAKFLDGKNDTELIRLFNLGMVPVLVGNPASVGHGLNLQAACSHVAYLSLTWNLENYDQFIKRVYRQGNESARVVVHLIIAKGTVDEVVYETLKGKDFTQKSLLSRLRSTLDAV